MMYGINSTFLEYKNISDLINSVECTVLFEPKDNICLISFRYKCDKLELQRLINEVIDQQCKQL